MTFHLDERSNASLRSTTTNLFMIAVIAAAATGGVLAALVLPPAAIAIVFAVASAVALAARAMVRRHVGLGRNRRDIERQLGVPVLAELPYDEGSVPSGRRSKVGFAASERPSSALAEAVSMLRVIVKLGTAEDPVRSIAVTSTEPSEGKSLVAGNLAVASARAGARTVLLTADLRRPTIGSTAAPAGTRGLAELLGRFDDDHLDLQTISWPTGVERLRYIPPGALDRPPVELLSSPKMRALLADLATQCDIVIIDCPPTIVADAVLIGSMADAAVVVADPRMASRHSIDDTLDVLKLARVRVLGVVVNRSRRKRAQATLAPSRSRIAANVVATESLLPNGPTPAPSPPARTAPIPSTAPSPTPAAAPAAAAAPMVPVMAVVSSTVAGAPPAPPRVRIVATSSTVATPVNEAPTIPVAVQVVPPPPPLPVQAPLVVAPIRQVFAPPLRPPSMADNAAWTG